MKKLLLLIYLLQCTHSFSQDLATLKWWSPTQYKSHVIEGQAWPDEVKSTYDRLPARAEGNVADDVWSLSSHSAGLMIRFRSNTKKIIVRYETKNKDNYAMDHMPATGVSGIDLYAIDSDGKENYIFVRANRLNIKVLKVDILFIEAEKDYVKLVTTKKNYLIRKNLKSFNKDVLDNSFIRISRSIIINIDKITLVDRNMVYLSDLRFKIGLNYSKNLNKLMKG